MDESTETIVPKKTVTGIFNDIVMLDYQSGYTVFGLLVNEKRMVCTGYIIVPNTGTKVKVTGEPQNTKWGNQLVNCVLEQDFTDTDAMAEYLTGIPGVGSAIANSLIETFGARLYRVAQREDAIELLSTVYGVTEKRAEVISDYIRKDAALRNLLDLINKHSSSRRNLTAAKKIVTEHGNWAVEALLKNPYEVGGKAGLPFRVCDSIGYENDTHPYNPIRVSAAIKYILRLAAKAGHTYLTYGEILKRTRQILNVSATEYNEAIATAIVNACLRNSCEGMVKDGDACYLAYVYQDEMATAKSICRLMQYRHQNSECVPEKMCAYAEKVCGVKYAGQQREAFNLLRTGGIGIITGGPGTGKTTVIKGLLAAYEKLYPDGVIKLCAPTGRASQRMKEATGREATTIHRLLEYKPFKETAICKNESDPIEADLLFVDEASMISIDVASLLFAAIKSGTTVLLAGDIDQLPAVGAGNFLHDLIESQTVPVVALTKTHRQADGSPIIENAKRIREGVTELISAPDFIIHTMGSSKEVADKTLEEFRKYYDPHNLFAVQVLTPSKKHKADQYATSSALNSVIQESVNPDDSEQIVYGNQTFRKSDKIMFMRNNYQEGYFNGDIGTVIGIGKNSLVIRVEDHVFVLDEEDFGDISLAYSCTIHKSQGSEFDTVIVVMPKEPSAMLQRNLIYTAVTRAKKRVILIEEEGATTKAIETKNALKRNSRLSERLRRSM